MYPNLGLTHFKYSVSILETTIRNIALRNHAQKSFLFVFLLSVVSRIKDNVRLEKLLSSFNL